MKNRIRTAALRIGILFVTLAALVSGTALPAVAAGPTNPSTLPNIPFHSVQGPVLSTGANMLVVKTGSQTQVTVNVDRNTRYFLVNTGKPQNPVNNPVTKANNLNKPVQSPQQRAKDLIQSHLPVMPINNPGQFSDIKVGDRVIVRADKNNLAQQVLIIKAPVNRIVKGSILLTDPTLITITPAGGSPITLNVTGATRILPKNQKSISGNAVVLYNSTNNNALVVTIQTTALAPKPAGVNKH